MRRIPRGGIVSTMIYALFILVAVTMFVSNLFTARIQTGFAGMGRPRRVNMQKLQQRIQSNTLSNHKAMFFKVIRKQ